jgi:large subunit ribosomal protein L25
MAIQIKAEKREKTGKGPARRLRHTGKVPAVLYGPDVTEVCLALDKKDVNRILKQGENVIFEVSYDSEKWNVMIKDMQVDPVTDELYHVDLIQISMDKPIRVYVPVHHVGEPVGVKSEGGIADWMTREIEIECLPSDIPEEIVVDISELHVNQSLRVEDITPPEGVRIVTDPDTVLVVIEAPVEEEVEVAAEEEIIGEEEEPEVIRKEKEEEEKKKEAATEEEE